MSRSWKRRSRVRQGFGLAVLATLVSAAGAQEPPPTLGAALRDGETRVTLRYRFEDVDDEAFEKEARASTLRTTLSYRTGVYRGFRLFLEAENVTELGAEDLFDNRGAGDLGNGVTDRPVIADPEITELHQTFLRFEDSKTTVDLGRQALVVGDERFVGPVGWRQNHQSFDALNVIQRSLPGTTFRYIYLDNVNRVFGDDLPLAGHLLRGEVETVAGKVAAFGLRLDFDRPAHAGLSTTTYGLELDGEHPVGGHQFLYELEAATQRETGDNPRRIDADYLHAVLGLGLRGWSVRLGWEVLAGSPGEGSFQTPLATLHKWNGWADKFLVTPANGLEDLYLRLTGQPKPFGWTVAYHRFVAESGGLDHGRELDLEGTYQAPWKQSFALKAAFYRADDFSTDTTKLWVQTGYAF
jgi:hypothetical protein